MRNQLILISLLLRAQSDIKRTGHATLHILDGSPAEQYLQLELQTITG